MNEAIPHCSLEFFQVNIISILDSRLSSGMRQVGNSFARNRFQNVLVGHSFIAVLPLYCMYVDRNLNRIMERKFSRTEQTEQNTKSQKWQADKQKFKNGVASLCVWMNVLFFGYIYPISILSILQLSVYIIETKMRRIGRGRGGKGAVKAEFAVIE